jgi:predicted MFS family arabinose efflux permease
VLVAWGAFWTAAAGAIPARVVGVSGVSGAGAIRIALLAGVGGTVLAALIFLPVARSAGRVRRRIPADARTSAPVDDTVADGKGLRAVAAGLRIPVGVGLLVALVAVWLVAGGLVIPFFNLYFLRRHGLPVATIGLIFAAAQGLAAVGVLASGEAAARFGTRRTLIAWLLVYGPLLWALAAVRDAGAGVALYVTQNLALPASNPLVDQILLERVAEDRQGAVSSWRNAATEGSGLFGASVGGVILQRKA